MTETVTVTTLITETTVLNESSETVTYVTPVIVTETVVVPPPEGQV